MMRCHLGDDVFFGGLKMYLENGKFGNPNTVDLLESWDQYIADNSRAENFYESVNENICNGFGKSKNGPVLPKTTKEGYKSNLNSYSSHLIFCSRS